MVGRTFLFALALAALAAGAFGSVVLEVTLERLADRADRIVRGRVTERSVVLERGGKRIWTRYHLRVTETFAGPVTKTLVVHTPGGRVGDRAEDVHGAARTAPEKDVVVFLWTDTEGRHRVLGQAQGLFEIESDADTGAATCRSSMDGLVLVGADGASRTGDGSSRSVSLADLKRRVGAARAAREAREEAERQARERKRKAAAERARALHEETRGQPGSSRE